MKTSIIIPSYNSGKTIFHTLDSLVPQLNGIDSEILIVDSSDDDFTENIIKKYISSNVKLIKSGTRVIPARQRNIGVRESTGDLLIFLDSDVIPAHDFISIIIDRYKNGYAAGCGSLSIPEFQLQNKIVIAQYLLQLNEYMPFGKPRVKEFPAGASIFCSKEVYLKSGGFPEIRAAEDVLFGKNVNKVCELWFFPQAVCRHIFRENRDGFFSNQKLLGEYVAIYRKENGSIGNIPKQVLTILYPLFFMLKLYKVFSRILKTDFKTNMLLLKVLLLFMMGVHHWTLGFLQGMKK